MFCFYHLIFYENNSWLYDATNWDCPMVRDFSPQISIMLYHKNTIIKEGYQFFHLPEYSIIFTNSYNLPAIYSDLGTLWKPAIKGSFGLVPYNYTFPAYKSNFSCL